MRKFPKATCLLLPLMAFVVAFATSCASGQPDVLQMISRAKTPADHEAIAEYYDSQATEAEKSAQLHEAMAQRYREMRTHPRWESPEHCVKIAQSYEDIAKQDSQLAAAHRAIAQQTH